MPGERASPFSAPGVIGKEGFRGRGEGGAVMANDGYVYWDFYHTSGAVTSDGATFTTFNAHQWGREEVGILMTVH